MTNKNDKKFQTKERSFADNPSNADHWLLLKLLLKTAGKAMGKAELS